MSTTTTFTPQLIGQTEKALNAILDRLLSGSGVSEPQWVVLSITAGSGEPIGRHRLSEATMSGSELSARVRDALKVSPAAARGLVLELAVAGLLELSEDERAPVKLSEAGVRLYAQVRSGVAEVTEQMWGDLPAEELAGAARVLGTILKRANAELA